MAMTVPFPDAQLLPLALDCAAFGFRVPRAIEAASPRAGIPPIE